MPLMVVRIYQGEPIIPGLIAQLVEQGTENPRVSSSILLQATSFLFKILDFWIKILYNIYRK